MADPSDDLLDPDEIEALLSAAGAGSADLPTESDDTDPFDLGEDDASAGGAAGAAERRGDGAVAVAEERPSAAPPSTGGSGGDARPNAIGGQVERLLEEVEADQRGRHVYAAGESVPPELGEPRDFDLPAFEAGPRLSGGDLTVLDDVDLDLRIELGRTEMLIDEVVGLREGSVVALDKLAGDPVDILANGRLIARGEVLVLNDNFCVRVAEILTPDR